MMIRRCTFRGFTLIEMMIVAVLILVLISMLLPAVQQVREAARRLSCQNNLVQMGIAIKHYETAFEHLPPGVISDKGPITDDGLGRDISFLLIILPYLEQTSVAEQFDFKEGAYAEVNSEIRNMTFRFYQCPSDSVRPSYSSYVGCHHHEEAPIDVDNTGLLFLNSAISHREISDGRSNTILLGEKISGGDDLGWVSGTSATLRNTGSFGYRNMGFVNAVVVNRQVVAIGNLPTNLFVGGFSSRHPVGCNFCFADGAVKLIEYDIDPVVLQELGHRADGAMMGKWD